MPDKILQIDFANTLESMIGVHGLAPHEIDEATAQVAEHVRRVEAQRAQGLHRYRDLPDDRAMLRAVQAAARRWRPSAENLVVLGIGGSALGNIALQGALRPATYNLLPTAKRGGPRLFVLDNVDPVLVGGVLDLLGPGLRRTVFNVISKSGETAETAAQLLVVRDLIARRLGPLALVKRIVVTTDARAGTLREWADREGFDTLPVPDGVGGRFSVLSAVGLFSAAMCGIRIPQLLAGAREMSRRAASVRVRENPAAMLALLLHALYVRGKRIHVFMPYCNQLRGLGDWYAQLWAESLGKQRTLDGLPVSIGPTPVVAIGATDQHSQVQLYREGPNDKVIIFAEVERFARDVRIPRGAQAPAPLEYLRGATLGRLLAAEKRATEFALTQSQRPNLTIRFPAVNEHTVGQFIMLWEAATTIMARLLNIDAYDQPAVQMGKEMTFALMGQPGYEAQAAEFAAYDRRRKARP